MKNREPYNIKGIMIAYNLFQVTLKWIYFWLDTTCLSNIFQKVYRYKNIPLNFGSFGNQFSASVGSADFSAIAILQSELKATHSDQIQVRI